MSQPSRTMGQQSNHSTSNPGQPRVPQTTFPNQAPASQPYDYRPAQSSQHVNPYTSVWPNGFPHRPPQSHPRLQHVLAAQQRAASQPIAPQLRVPIDQYEPRPSRSPARDESPEPFRTGNEFVSRWEVVDWAFTVAGIERRVRFLDEKGVENVHEFRTTEHVSDNEWKTRTQCPSSDS